MYERIAADWSLPPVVDHTPITEQYPLACDFVGGVMGEKAWKHLLIPMADRRGRRPFFLSAHTLAWVNATDMGGTADERGGHNNNGKDGEPRRWSARISREGVQADSRKSLPISHYRFTADAVALTRSKLGRYEQIWRQYESVKNTTKGDSNLRKAQLELDGMSSEAADFAKVGAAARSPGMWEDLMKERLRRYAEELAMLVPRGDPDSTWQIVEKVRSKPRCVNLNLPETSRKQKQHEGSATAPTREDSDEPKNKLKPAHTPLLHFAHLGGWLRAKVAHAGPPGACARRLQ